MKTKRLENGLLVMNEDPYKGILVHEGSKGFRGFENNNPRTFKYGGYVVMMSIDKAIEHCGFILCEEKECSFTRLELMQISRWLKELKNTKKVSL